MSIETNADAVKLTRQVGCDALFDPVGERQNGHDKGHFSFQTASQKAQNGRKTALRALLLPEIPFTNRVLFCVEHRTWQGQALPLRSLQRDCGSVQRSGDPCGRQAPRKKSEPHPGRCISTDGAGTAEEWCEKKARLPFTFTGSLAECG